VEQENYDIGVLIGRWQVPELHGAHVKIIEDVIKGHPKCIVFIGTTPVLGSKENPLDYHCRDMMIRRRFLELVVTAPLPDFKSDKVWSDNLDTQIRAIYPKGTVCLYGGRDSFIKHYTGKFDCKELPSIEHQSGEDIRREIGELPVDSIHFREGIIHSTQNNYSRTYQTVDVAIIKKETGELLLGRKPNEDKFRFIGGFVEGETLEATARREAYEETGASVDGISYVKSYAINDWRYRNCSDKIVTAFFVSYYIFGHIKANDDIEEVKWFKLADVQKDMLVGNHQIMLEDLKKLMIKEKS
jgi:bifunctional NMN adenylyltransferase/nudix hydrolase